MSKETQNLVTITVDYNIILSAISALEEKADRYQAGWISNYREGRSVIPPRWEDNPYWQQRKALETALWDRED